MKVGKCSFARNIFLIGSQFYKNTNTTKTLLWHSSEKRKSWSEWDLSRESYLADERISFGINYIAGYCKESAKWIIIGHIFLVTKHSLGQYYMNRINTKLLPCDLSELNYRKEE
jgi:hypothetical protein